MASLPFTQTEWLTEIAGYRFIATADAPPAHGLDFEIPYLREFVRSSEGEGGLPVRVELGAVETPRGEPVFRRGPAWSAYDGDGGLEFVLQGGLPRPCCSMRWHRRSRNFRVRFDPKLAAGERVLNPFRYPLDSIALKLVMRDGLVLHASTLVLDGKAQVFVGVSGAGKTTIARVLRGRGTVLSDDRVVLRKENEEWRVYGTPWASDLGAAVNDSAPLGRLFVLEQGVRNETHALTVAETLDALLPCVSLPVYDEAALDAHLAAAQGLARDSGAHRLVFLPIEGVLDAIQAI